MAWAHQASPKGRSVLLPPHRQGAVVLAPRVASVAVAVGLVAAGWGEGGGGGGRVGKMMQSQGGRMGKAHALGRVECRQGQANGMQDNDTRAAWDSSAAQCSAAYSTAQRGTAQLTPGAAPA